MARDSAPQLASAQLKTVDARAPRTARQMELT